MVPADLDTRVSQYVDAVLRYARETYPLLAILPNGPIVTPWTYWRVGFDDNQLEEAAWDILYTIRFDMTNLMDELDEATIEVFRAVPNDTPYRIQVLMTVRDQDCLWVEFSQKSPTELMMPPDGVVK